MSLRTAIASSAFALALLVPQAASAVTATTTVSTPSAVTIMLGRSATDGATVAGDPVVGPPTGTMSFFVCGPLPSASGCASGGQSLGGGVPVSSAGGSTATATSPSFTPASAGIWCFRSEYSGDSNYSASIDGGPGECFTVPQPGAPSATVASPKNTAIYAVGQVVNASYGCAEASAGPGIASCVGTVANGSRVDTSTPGVHTIRVTAASLDGLSTTVFSSYTVAGPPSVSISSPADGITYTRHQSVPLTFTCAEDDFGPGLASCSGPSQVRTAQLGPYSISVTAVSVDGQRTTRTVDYRVMLPSNHFVVSRLRSHPNGQVSFRLAIRNPGTVRIVETVSGRALPTPGNGRVVFASRRLTAGRAGALNLVVTPNARGRSVMERHRGPVAISLTVTYTPAHGAPRHAVFTGLRTTR